MLQKMPEKARLKRKTRQKVNIKFIGIAKAALKTVDKPCFVVYNDTIQTP